MSNQLKFEEEARESLRVGAEKVFRAVSSTIGAKGRNVVRQNFGRPKITNDGVTVARSINLEDPFERQGAELLKEAAENTNKEAGDGTTTATILAYHFYERGLELIKGGWNSMVLRSAIESEVQKIIAKLKEISVPVETHEDLENIASISIESPEYGKIVADAVRVAGKDGIVVIDDGEKEGVVKEEISGYRFERGLENPYLVTDAQKMEADLKGVEGAPVYILVADKSWNLVGDLLPMFEEVKKNSDKMLIIAEEISGELMAFITKNRLSLRFHTVVVKTPFNKDMLEDIAALTGATVISAAKGIVNVKKSHLGTAKRIIVSRETTTIIDGGGDPTEKIGNLRKQVEDAEDGYDKGKLQERLSKLTGKTVVLKVGAATEAESKYLKDKLEDAVNATKAAVEEGIVPGGGMAFMRIAQSLYPEESYPEHSIESLMGHVLVSPIVKIMQNAGLSQNDAAAIGEKLEPMPKAGFDALKGEVVEDIVAAGIIDPTKVERVALKNASSLACILLTVETVIAEIPEKTNAI